MVAEIIGIACHRAGATADDHGVFQPSMSNALHTEQHALAAQGMANVGRKYIELCHHFRGLPPGHTKALLCRWAPGTQDAYGNIFSKWASYCWARARSVVIANDILLSAYLVTKIGTLAGSTIATISSAICMHYAIAIGIPLSKSQLVISAVTAGKVALPAERRYLENFAFRLVDEHICHVLAQNNDTLTEYVLLAKCLHLFLRYGWGRAGELRGPSRDRLQLSMGTGLHPCNTTPFDDARRMKATLQGTKNGAGPMKQAVIQIDRPREWVIGTVASQGLDLFAALAAYERRTAGRDIGPRQSPQRGYVKAHEDSHLKFGTGFFVSTQPCPYSGKYYYLQPDTLRSYNTKLIHAAGVPVTFKGHAVRHAGISLLCDAGTPETWVAAKARHTPLTARRVYRHPSETEHMQRAIKLRQDVPSVTAQELLCCALTPRNQRTTAPPV